MGADAREIRDFLAGHPPFDLLPKQTQLDVAAVATVAEFAQGAVAMRPGDDVGCLYVVRRGAFETKDPNGQLLARLTAGECFGVRALLRGGRAVNGCEAIENSVVYMIPAATFDELRAAYPSFSYFFAAFDGGRLGDAMQGGGRELNQLSRRVSELLIRPPVTAPLSASLRDAAQRMDAEKVSSLLVVDEAGALAGILTDKDLRRAVANALPVEAPVAQAMTASPYCVQASDYVLDAMLTMSRRQIRHVPVLDGGRLAGCLSTSLVLDAQSNSPLFLARRVHGAKDVAALREAVGNVPKLVEGLAGQGAGARSIGHIVTSITDAVTERLIAMAEAEFGPPPVSYAWMAAGSQARQEQTALSDQDNCMILHDDYDPAAHGDYFRKLAKFVCDGLNECGYVYCPGEMMAMTDKWRQPLSVWTRYFLGWIREPEPTALMLSSVFFDMRVIHGDAALFEKVQTVMAENCRNNHLFLAFMTTNALARRPPLGFFRNLVLISGGDHDHTMDLKHNGIVPIIDMARVYALSAGVGAVNTFDRLEAAFEARALSRDSASDLRDALEFIAMARLRHQAKLIREGKPADNFVPPDELSSFDRAHLKSAFAVVKSMQTALGAAYQAGRF